MITLIIENYQLLFFRYIAAFKGNTVNIVAPPVIDVWQRHWSSFVRSDGEREFTIIRNKIQTEYKNKIKEIERKQKLAEIASLREARAKEMMELKKERLAKEEAEALKRPMDVREALRVLESIADQTGNCGPALKDLVDQASGLSRAEAMTFMNSGDNATFMGIIRKKVEKFKFPQKYLKAVDLFTKKPEEEVPAGLNLDTIARDTLGCDAILTFGFITNFCRKELGRDASPDVIEHIFREVAGKQFDLTYPRY